MESETTQYDMYEAIKQTAAKAAEVVETMGLVIANDEASLEQHLIVTNQLLARILQQLIQSELHRVIESDPDNRRVSGGRISTGANVPVRVSDR